MKTCSLPACGGERALNNGEIFTRRVADFIAITSGVYFLIEHKAIRISFPPPPSEVVRLFR